jgi:hypothetical protein
MKKIKRTWNLEKAEESRRLMETKKERKEIVN